MRERWTEKENRGKERAVTQLPASRHIWCRPPCADAAGTPSCSGDRAAAPTQAPTYEKREREREDVV